MAHYGKTFNHRYRKSLNKDKVFFSTHCVLASYLLDFTHKITQCCKQELSLCVISLIPSFLAEFVKNVSDKDKAVQCDLCELWVHIKCNNLNYLDHRYLQNSNESWYCVECYSAIFPLTPYYVTKLPVLLYEH